MAPSHSPPTTDDLALRRSLVRLSTAVEHIVVLARQARDRASRVQIRRRRIRGEAIHPRLVGLLQRVAKRGGSDAREARVLLAMLTEIK